MNLSPEQIMVGIGGFLGLWYLVASFYNRRRGIATYRWLRDGLRVLGDKYEGRWLGSASSGARLSIPKADSPFRRVEVLFLLESRELLPLWLFDILRDKRDQVIFKATTRAAWQTELEIAPSSSTIARRIRSRIDNTWTVSELGRLLVASRGRDATSTLERLGPVLESYGAQVRHLSWSMSRPNLIAIFNLLDLLKTGSDAADLFTCIRSAISSTSPGQPRN